MYVCMNACPSQGYPPRRIKFAGTMGRERRCESKVSFPRTQHNVPGQGSNLERSIKEIRAIYFFIVEKKGKEGEDFVHVEFGGPCRLRMSISEEWLSSDLI